MSDYPAIITPVNHVEPVPRRVRGFVGNETVFDTINAKYVWEWQNYPQYYIPVDDVRTELLVSENEMQHSPRGEVELHALKIDGIRRPNAAKVLRDSPLEQLSGTVRFEWGALDAWFEEDEKVFVHARNPYARVDALRSTRSIRIELEGAVLGASSSSIMVFETGLPTRYYLNRTELDFSHLLPSEKVTSCPYKGTTSSYWSVKVGGRVHPDLAWSYEFPTYQMLPIAGLVAFYNETVDIFIDGRPLDRPKTHFFND